MNEEMLNKIQALLPEISQRLQVASEVVWEKVLWYVRADGVVNLLRYGIIFVLMLVINIYVTKWFKKNWEMLKGYGDDISVPVFLGVIFYLLGNALLFGVIHDTTIVLVDNLAKIIVPEYWIIDQLINKVLVVK